MRHRDSFSLFDLLIGRFVNQRTGGVDHGTLTPGGRVIGERWTASGTNACCVDEGERRSR